MSVAATERFIGSVAAARLGQIPPKGALLRLLDLDWPTFCGNVASMLKLDQVEDYKELMTALRHRKWEEAAEFTDIAGEDTLVRIAYFPDWQAAGDDFIEMGDMLRAVDDLLAAVEKLDDEKLEAELLEWFRYEMLFLYRRAYTYGWDAKNTRDILGVLPFGDRIAVLAEKGLPEPKLIASELGISPDLADIPLDKMEILVEEEFVRRLMLLSLLGNSIYTTLFYLAAFRTFVKDLQVIASAIWWNLPKEETVERVRDTHV